MEYHCRVPSDLPFLLQDRALQPNKHEAFLLFCGSCAPGPAATAGGPPVFCLLHGATPHEGMCVWTGVGQKGYKHTQSLLSCLVCVYVCVGGGEGMLLPGSELELNHRQ